jgi:hypothetical protein
MVQVQMRRRGHAARRKVLIGATHGLMRVAVPHMICFPYRV